MAGDSSIAASRRTVIAATVCSLVPVAGCSALESDPPMLDLVVFNYTDSPFTVTIELFRSGNNQTRNEAKAFASTIDVEPGGETRLEDAVENDQYLIEYDVDRIVEGDPLETDRDHTHFYPTGDGENNSIAFDIVRSGKMNKRI